MLQLVGVWVVGEVPAAIAHVQQRAGLRCGKICQKLTAPLALRAHSLGRDERAHTDEHALTPARKR
eukprot:5998045-Pleurochrysis_carterae.AAC.4